MTVIVVDELKTTLSQELTVLKRIDVESIRLKLYFHNDPPGTFTVKLKEGATELSSKSITLAEIKSSASWLDNEYHWGMILFNLDNNVPVQKDVTYTIELSASGYSFNESSYVGWIKEHEDETNTFTKTTGTDFNNPFSYQLWGY